MIATSWRTARLTLSEGLPARMDPLLLVMMAVLALFIFFQFRTSKKRKAEQEVLGTKMVPGAEVMTQFGVFGTLLSIDEDSNEALLETTPGTIIRLHRQTILKVVEDDVIVEDDIVAEDTVEESAIDDTIDPGARPDTKKDD